MSSNRTVALVEGLAAVAIWGVSFIATKIALREIAPVTLVWLRFAMGVAVLAVAATHRREIAALPPRDVVVLGLLGLQGISFHQWLQSTALVTSQAATSGWIVASAPVFIAAFAWLLLRERLHALQVAGIGVAALGVAGVVSGGDPTRLLAGELGAPGDVLIVVSAANWAVFSVLSRGVLRRLPPVGAMFWVMTFGWLGSTALLPLGPGVGEITRLSVTGWAAATFLGVLCSGVAYLLWYDALHRSSAARVGAVLYAEPLFAQVAAAAILGEALQLATIAGGAVILAGVWMVNRERDGRRRTRVVPGEDPAARPRSPGRREDST